MKMVTIVGARPQFIKAAAVSRALRRCRDVEELLIHTGQHYCDNMSGIFFEELEVPVPELNLGIGSLPHGAQTGRMLEAIESALLEHKPDCVLVYGDTNSTLAGALAAVKLHITVAHVESGLRSFNRRMPEEINRVVADHCCDILFCPTELAVLNLKKEGIPESRLHLVGDVMYDAALFHAAKSDKLGFLANRPYLKKRGYILATVHRAENTDDEQRLEAVFRGLMAAAERMPVVVPLHPRTRKALAGNEKLLGDAEARLHLIEPVGYLEMIALERHAALVATDSGGVQKEAYFHRTPCVTLRDETEWLELVENGWNTIAPPRDAASVEQGIVAALEKGGGKNVALYGDGHSSERIVEILRGHPCGSR